MRILFSVFLILLSLSCAGPPAIASDGNSLNIVIINTISEITSQDIEDISLTYSKQADAFFASIKFRESGEKKIEASLKSNIDRYISITLGDTIVAMPVPIKTEKVFNPLTVQINDESTALKLLKLKAE